MYVLFDDAGYITDYALVGEIDGAVEVAEPDDVQTFIKHFRAYRRNGKALVCDAAKKVAYEKEAAKTGLRYRREEECFPIINRGSFWHETLSADQVSELRQWYKAWLDVTDTLIIPEKPNWLK